MKSTATNLSFTGIKPVRTLLLCLTLALPLARLGAQVLINPNAEGGFELGPTFGDNGWVVTNGNATNKWFLGTVPTGFSNRSAFVSDDGGTSYHYSSSSIGHASVVHFWRDVTFPAGVMDFTLTFSFKGVGESSFDELLVSWAPTYYTPVGGFGSLGNGVLPAPVVNVGRIHSHSSVQTITLHIAGGSDLGNCDAPVTRRLIFTWKSDFSVENNPPAAVDNIRLEAGPPIMLTINDPTDRCSDGADMHFVGTPTPAGGATGTFEVVPSSGVLINNNGTGSADLDVSASDPGVYTVYYQYMVNGCNYEILTMVEVFEAPKANLRETLVDCKAEGEMIDLGVMFDSNNSPGGIFSIRSGPATTIMDSLLTIPAGGGCYLIRYVQDDNPHMCTNPPYADSANLLITLRPEPELVVTGATSPVCQDGGQVQIDVQRNSTGANPIVTINGDTVTLGTNFLDAPAMAGSTNYTICLTETNNQPAACGGLPAMGYTPCSATVCKTIIVYNDGFACGANAPFPSECPPDLDASDVCEIETHPSLDLSCSFFTISALDVIEATLTPEDALIPCDQEEVCLDWEGTLPGTLGDIAAGGPTLGDLNSATSAVCDIITYEFCISIPFISDPCFDPIPLGSWEDYCDKTIGQAVFGILSEFIGGDGGGGTIVADTDGDGAFDYAAYDYGFPAQSDDANETQACVPNNVTMAQGTITVRNVVSWPFAAEGVCGVVNSQEINLLELLPIGAIPIIGIIVEDLLAAASCNVNLVFSDEETVEIPVINTNPPVFANCNESGYVFSEDLICDTEVNWSIPVAYDGCYGEVLPYRGRTSMTIDSFYTAGMAPDTVSTTQSGIYQTFGPIPGSDLPPGTYTVIYTAYSCAGISSICSFPVIVTAGDPVLACPANMTVRTDVDECQAIVTGLSPVQGIGCATVINYTVDYPSVPGFVDVSTNTPLTAPGTHNDVSGLPFPLGTTTVTYRMLVDINGDGNATGPGEDTNCSFTVTVEDAQKPVAACVDIEVKLDNTGAITVYAADPGTGAPFIDGGSTDNCDSNPLIEIAEPGGSFFPAITFDCDDEGSNFLNLRVTDDAGNQRICLAHVKVKDFFDGIEYDFDLPELCLEANNPTQFDFSNYLNITLPNGTNLNHHQVAGSAYLGDAVGAFGITAFLPDPSSPSLDPGSITSNGVYTPGTGSGFVTVSYVLVLPGFTIPPNGNVALAGCFEIVHATFELRQPLTMASPECMCFDGNERIVDLGVVSGGLEPYRIQYTGVKLDVNSDGTADDADGIYTYDAANGHVITDFQQDLGELRVVYTQPVWSFTIVDARGCEIFRSGSCDNDDLTEGPMIPCTQPQVVLTTEALLCEAQYGWNHPLPTDNCAVTLYDYRIYNPDGTIDGPHNLNALVNLAPGAPLPALFHAEYEFQLGVSTVTYYAEDAQGNLTTCSFTVLVTDNDPPYFINCPVPPVVQDAESVFCDAYVNFALPLAQDNCSVPVVTQIDGTGLTTGDRFPVGTTVMYWEAIDPSGNRDTCQIKVIVNDYLRVPELDCPGDVAVPNDPWLCGATVNDIAPEFSGPCQDNLSVTYSIYADAALTQRKDCGVWDASGVMFDQGSSWVKYTVRTQPLLLISEVSQSGAVDRLEITNLGPAAIDITCLMVSRTSSNPLANENLAPVSMLPSLAGTIVPVGGVFVFDFAFNAPANTPACYKIAYFGNLIDEVALNGFAGCGNFTGTLTGGDAVRMCEDDSNTAADWIAPTACDPLSLGMPGGLDVMPDNGTLTSLQSVVATKNTCVFKVTVNDVEDPFCGQLDAMTTYNGPGIPNITPATCNQSTITIPPGNCIIGEIVFSLTGTATPANSKMTLISPMGTEVLITELPDDSIAAFFAQKAQGVWTLDIVPNAGQTPTVTGWSLKITCLDTFDLADQVIGNDPGQCGANFTWKHPYFVDNCFDGTISVAYTSNDAACVPTGGPLLGLGGYTTTKFFCVGTTTVTYTLVDGSGNTETCSFQVTVEDREDPVVTCPQDIFIYLNGGECGKFVSYGPVFTDDNCAVTDTLMTPPSGSWFPIGDSIVYIIVYDAAGNADTCFFFVHIIEFVPVGGSLICNDLEHVSLDSTCIYVVDADAALEGSNYHCYDDYVIIIKNSLGLIVGNTFGSADIGKTFTVTVLDPETGNSCWTQMKIEDKLKPDLTCPPNVTVACSESTEVDHTGDVAVEDCSPTTRVIDDNFTNYGVCSDPRGKIVRTWYVTDAWGNQSACSQTITIDRFELSSVIFPSDVTIDCEDVYLDAGATEPEQAGAPSINGASILGSVLCGAKVNFTDNVYAGCGGTYTILRTWSVLDDCLPVGPNNPRSDVQSIKVEDLGGPKFTCPPAVTVSTDPFTCCATAALPDVIVSEGCSQIGNLEAKVTGTNPSNGNVITFTVPGILTDFPGNNYWHPDTLAVFDYTQCLPLGVYNVTYSAEDQCANLSKCTFKMTVADLVPPVAACQQVTQVALGGNGMALIDAGTFDSGSSDNCSPVEFRVRRMNSNSCQSANKFYEQVKFCCSDLNDTILVVFRVYDVNVPNGDINLDSYDGHYNDCMVQVLVEDKIKPTCNAPANMTVSCENFDPTLVWYGFATAVDNCCMDTITGQNNYSLFDTVCNRGTITRTFQAFDCAGQSSTCTQRVFVDYEQEYWVKFPNDVIVTVCDGTGNYGEPIFNKKDCELLGVSFEDEIFTVVPDACFKIERTWTIINWCTYNPNLPCIYVPNPNPNAITNHPTNLPGPTVSPAGTPAPWAPTVVKIDPDDPTTMNYSIYYDADANCYKYKQIIKIIDTQAPTADCPPSPQTFCDETVNSQVLWNETYWWDGVISSHDLCEGPTDLHIDATDACSGANIGIEYLLFLDLDNDGVMETVVSSTDLPGTNNVQYGNALNPNFTGGTPRAFDERNLPIQQQYRFAIDRVKNGSTLKAYVRWDTQSAQANSGNTTLDGVTPELPYGTHKIKWIVSDGCGNQTVCEYTFLVKDCKPPTVVCINGLSVNIMPTDMIQLWATDFLQYGEDNCTPPTFYTPGSQLKYGIRKSGDGTGFPVDAFGQPITNVTFTCDELGTQTVELWAQDLAGNAAYCETYVIVQDPLDQCGGDQLTVAGTLKTEPGAGAQGVEEASVNLEGTPSSALPPVSLFGLSNSTGLYAFGNALPLASNYTVTPLKDDNPMNGVSTFDLVLISKHILGAEPLNSPYKIIAADINKSNSVTTFDIVELRKLILGIYTTLPNNTSWRFLDNSFQFAEPGNPFASLPLAENISLADIQHNEIGEDFVGIKIGDVNGSVVPNATAQSDDRSAGTLLLDVEDRSVKAGETFDVTFKTAEAVQGFQFTLNLNGLEVDVIADQGKVTAGNFGVFADALTASIDGTNEFTVRFRALQAGKLSRMIQLSSRVTRTEAYSMTDSYGTTKMDVALRFSGQTIAGVGFELYQNQPNPWIGKTQVGFHLPEAATATLTVYDETGRVLFTNRGDFAKGYNAVSLDRAVLNTTGVLYYKLETATDTATKKMIQTK